MRLSLFLLLIFSFNGNAHAQHADTRLLDKLNNADRSSGTFKLIRFITHSATPVSLATPVVLLTTGMIENRADLKRKAVYMFESLLASQAVTIVSKKLVHRERPFVTYPFIIQKVNADAYSFPSGHTSFAFSMATSLSIACPKWYVIVPAATYASSVGYSRMYLGVHYPTDVIAGAIVGSGSAYLTYKANKWLHRSKHRNLSVSW